MNQVIASSPILRYLQARYCNGNCAKLIMSADLWPLSPMELGNFCVHHTLLVMQNGNDAYLIAINSIHLALCCGAYDSAWVGSE